MLLILFLLFPLGQLIKLPLAIAGVSVYFHDLVLAAIWLDLIFSGRVKNIFQTKLAKPIFIFAIIAFLSWLINLSKWGSKSILGLGYLVRWMLLTGVYFALPRIINRKSEILNILRFSLFLTAFLGWGQYLFFPDLRHLKYLGGDDHYYRLTGTFLDPNFMGIILALAFGLEKKFLKKLFYLITLFFTYSRSSWLALLVLVVTNVFKKRNFRFLVFLFSFSILAFSFFPRPTGEGGNLLRTFSIQSRWRNWRQSWRIIKENPIFGVGFNNYALASPNYQKADNSFLLVWATSGIFGLVAFCWLIFSLRPLQLILPVVVHSFFNNSLFYPWVLVLIWALQ